MRGAIVDGHWNHRCEPRLPISDSGAEAVFGGLKVTINVWLKSPFLGLMKGRRVGYVYNIGRKR